MFQQQRLKYLQNVKKYNRQYMQSPHITKQYFMSPNCHLINAISLLISYTKEKPKSSYINITIPAQCKCMFKKIPFIKVVKTAAVKTMLTADTKIISSHFPIWVVKTTFILSLTLCCLLGNRNGNWPAKRTCYRNPHRFCLGVTA